MFVTPRYLCSIGIKMFYNVSSWQIIGCGFHREPEESTVRFTRWANCLSEEQLLTQVDFLQNVDKSASGWCYGLLVCIKGLQ